MFEDPDFSPRSESCGSYRYPFANPPILREPDVHFSFAPLNDVRWIEIFYRHSEDSLHPRGILLGYENGGQRALGECRIYEDAQKTYEMPTSFCFCNSTSFELSGGLSNSDSTYAAVAVGTAFAEPVETHAHDDWIWECFEMAGTLMCWFTEVEGHFSVIDGKRSHLSVDDQDLEGAEEKATTAQWRTMQCVLRA